MIENPKAERVKRVAALARKKERQLSGKFLVEGPQAVRELLRFQAANAECVYATTGTEPWQHEIDRLCSETAVRLERVTPAVLAAMCETVHPQGVVAVAAAQLTPPETALAGAKLVAILNEIRDPGNAGTILRVADAVGADAVMFVGESIDPFHPKVVRATTGSLFHVPVCVLTELPAAVQLAQQAGLQVWAADIRGDDVTSAREAGELAAATAWVFGNEARGLSEQDRSAADRSITLPMYGSAESLNLATAASVLLYESAFAHRAAETHRIRAARRTKHACSPRTIP